MDLENLRFRLQDTFFIPRNELWPQLLYQKANSELQVYSEWVINTQIDSDLPHEKWKKIKKGFPYVKFILINTSVVKIQLVLNN